MEFPWVKNLRERLKLQTVKTLQKYSAMSEINAALAETSVKQYNSW